MQSLCAWNQVGLPMRYKPTKSLSHRSQYGVTLIELIVFMVVVSISLAAVLQVYQASVKRSVDPVIYHRAIHMGQGLIEKIMALKYDEQTPTGGVPACLACDNQSDANMNDVDDYAGFTDSPDTGYTRRVSITTLNNIKTVRVEVEAPQGVVIRLAVERANF